MLILDSVQHILDQEMAAHLHAQSTDGEGLQKSKPLVLVTSSLATTQTGRWPVYTADATSMDVLREVGTVPLACGGYPLTSGDPLELLVDDAAFGEAFRVLYGLVVQLDICGLYVPGGGDLLSCLYGQRPGVQTGEAQIWQDLWERYLLLLAWVFRWPVLGVCRGMQHMNVVLGGGLIQDLTSQWRSLWAPHRAEFAPLPLVRHRLRGWHLSPSSFVQHRVLVDGTSQLARSYTTSIPAGHDTPVQASGGTYHIDVLSMHHQAVGFLLPNGQPVGYLAPGLRASAIAPDGVIEAIEWEGTQQQDTSPRRFWLGVQWHPEWLAQDAWSRALYHTFAVAAAAYVPLPRTTLERLTDYVCDFLRACDRSLLRAQGTVPQHARRFAPTASQARIPREGTQDGPHTGTLESAPVEGSGGKR